MSNPLAVPGVVSNPELEPSAENKFHKLFLEKSNVPGDFKGFSPGISYNSPEIPGIKNRPLA